MRIIDKLIAGLKHLHQPVGLPPVLRDAIPVAHIVTNGRAFKIVQNLGNGELWSYSTSGMLMLEYNLEPTATELRYFPGHATRPGFGKLFVLDSLKHAEAMLDGRHNLGPEIWAADVCGEEPINYAYYEDPRAFWEGGMNRGPLLPVGTLVCNAVTLRERVA